MLLVIWNLTVDAFELALVKLALPERLACVVTLNTRFSKGSTNISS